MTIYLIIFLFLPVTEMCILLLNGWVPVSVEKRARSAEIVVSGFVRETFKQQRTRANTYSVEFNVVNAFKGDEALRKIKHTNNIFNISNFGDTKMCYADLEKECHYILFLTTFKGRLSAKYDDIFGAATRYTEESEQRILTSLGWTPWNDWSPCSKSCQTGAQIRTRQCSPTCAALSDDVDKVDDVTTSPNCAPECSGADAQQRSCNMFSCQDTKNLMDYVPKWRLPAGVTESVQRAGAYTISRQAALYIRSSRLYPNVFPSDFTLLFGLGLANQSHGYVVSVADYTGRIKMAVKTGTTSLEFYYIDQHGRQNNDQPSVFDVAWTSSTYHELSLAVEADSVTLYMDCQYKSTMPLPRSRQPIKTIDTVVSIGVPFGPGNEKMESFEGDIEQIQIVADPSAAKNQCSPQVTSSSSPRQHRASITTADDVTAARPGSRGEDEHHREADTNARRADENANDLNAPDVNKNTEIGPPKNPDSNPENDDIFDPRDREKKEMKSDDIKMLVSWSVWSSCSTSCGEGIQTRDRYCRSNRLSRDGDQCSFGDDPNSEQRLCIESRCPVVCSLTCNNGGACNDNGECSCMTGYFGDICQYAHCTPPCLNGGRCVAVDTCECVAGYGGHYCQTAVCDEPCSNGGTCIAPNYCACLSGYTGAGCNQVICDPPCQNKGTCQQPHHCWCKPGSHGKYCQYFECQRACENGGECVAPNTCRCPFGTSGKQCQHVTRCQHVCLNGGRCVISRHGDPRCKCPHGFTGSRCERRMCVYKPVHETYIRGYRHVERYDVVVPCNTWSWRLCTKPRLEYKMMYRIAIRTDYICT